MIIVIMMIMMMMTIRTTIMINFVILISAFRGQSHQGKDKKFGCVVKTLLISLVFFKQLLHQTMSFLYNVCGLSAAIWTVCRYLGVFFRNAPRRSPRTYSYFRLTYSESLRQTAYQQGNSFVKNVLNSALKQVFCHKIVCDNLYHSMELKFVKFWPYNKRLKFGGLETENSIALLWLE